MRYSHNLLAIPSYRGRIVLELYCPRTRSYARADLLPRYGAAFGGPQ